MIYLGVVLVLLTRTVTFGIGINDYFTELILNSLANHKAIQDQTAKQDLAKAKVEEFVTETFRRPYLTSSGL